VLTLEDLTTLRGRPRIDLLFIDAPGHEWEALRAVASSGSRVMQVSARLVFVGKAELDTTFGSLTAAGYREHTATLDRSNAQQYAWVRPEYAQHLVSPTGEALSRSRALGYCAGSPYSCAEEFVGWYGDGWKWVCGARALPASDCVVYSFGGSSNTQFDIDFARRTACEVHTFDMVCAHHCPYGECYPTGNTCHEIALGVADGVPCSRCGNGTRTLSLPSIMRELGHHKLDVLKLDIEGGEADVLNALLDADGMRNVGQLLLEWHVKDWPKMRRRLEQHGFVLFHKEHNLLAPPGLLEYAFVRPGFYTSKPLLGPFPCPSVPKKAGAAKGSNERNKYAYTVVFVVAAICLVLLLVLRAAVPSDPSRA